MFGFGHVTTSIPLFVTREMAAIDALRRFGLLTTCWHRALVTMARMVGVVVVATEVAGAMKPQPVTG